MNRWKASLGLNAGDPIHEANDPASASSSPWL